MEKSSLPFTGMIAGFIGAFFIILSPLFSHAQFYPVQSSVQLIPPYSVYLSDYATHGSERLRVILVHRDLTKPTYQLRMVMNIEWNGKLIMRTSRAFSPRPITLDPGIPTIISGADLAPYLDIRNIDFIGYSRSQYERTKSLPEGSYRISFTAYDYRRQDVQVSNEGSTFNYLSKNEPPFVNLPLCGSLVPLQTPQFIVFSWMPRNTSSANSAGETEYELSLYETRPAGRNPNDVVLTSQPVFRTTTDITQFVYGPSEPQLLMGITYVWRVRAIDKQGRDAFRNNGYSEVCTFRVGADPMFDVGGVRGFTAEVLTDRQARISWEAGEVNGYRVFYKKSGKDFEWFNSDTRGTELKIYDLEPNTEYETKIQAIKNGSFGPYSETLSFRTPPTKVVQCGEEEKLTPALNTPPLLSATQGMMINARGMELQLQQVSHTTQDGWYSGTGRVTVPYLGGATFSVKFENIYIDENRNVGSGRIDFVTRGVAAMAEEQLANQKDRQLEKQNEENRTQWAGTDFYENIFYYNEIEIENITIDANSLVVTDPNGISYPNAEIIPIFADHPEKAVIIEDKNGDQWVVQKDKTSGEIKVTKVEGGGLNPYGDVVVNKDDLEVVRLALKELRKEFSGRIDEYNLPAEKIEYSIAHAVLLFSEESNKQKQQLIAAGLDVDGKKLTEYLTEGRTAKKSEEELVATVKNAIVALIGDTMKKVLLSLDDVKEQLTKAIGPDYRSSLGAGPLAPAYFLPLGMPEDTEDRAIIRDYLEIRDRDKGEANRFLTNLFTTQSQTLGEFKDEEQLWKFVTAEAGRYYVDFKFRLLEIVGECAERGYDKFKEELFNQGIQSAFIAAQLEALICLTEKDKCQDSNAPTQFTYGLTNGLLQQLNIPEMRDGFIDLVKSNLQTRFNCLLNWKSLKDKLTITNANSDPKEAIKIISECMLGISVDPNESAAAFDAAWTFVKDNYTDPYFQGQAAAFIVTIVLPPVIKALQASKLGQMLRGSRTALVNKVKSLDDLPRLAEGLDDVGKAVGEGSISGVDNILDDLSFEQVATDVKYLPGPQLPEKIAATFENSLYTNKQLVSNQRYFKYHGTNNRTGKKYTWLVDKKYGSEVELRRGLAIREDWGVQIEFVSEFDVPTGTWISEGKAAPQGIGYPGGDHQVVILNVAKSWIVKTDKAF
jgi:hypothetical protein